MKTKTARGETLARMALAWVLQNNGVTGVLIGASRPMQIRENVNALDGAPFRAEEPAKIDEIVNG